MNRFSVPTILLLASLVFADVDERVVDLHRSFLSSEELGVVRVGSSGYSISLRYIATEMERLGYSGAGRGGDWFHARTATDLRPAPVTRLVSSVGKALAKDAFSPLPISGEGALSGGLRMLRIGSVAPGSAEGVVLLVLRGAGEAPEEAAVRAAAFSPAAILIMDGRGMKGVDEVYLAAGGVLVGRVVDRGREFLVRESRTGRIHKLTPEMVREIRFDVRHDPGADWAWRTAPGRSLSVPVLRVTHAGVEALTGQKLAALLDKGVPDGLRLRVNVAFERRMREVREVRAARARPGGRVVTIRARVDRGEKGGAASAALGLAAALVGRDDLPAEFRFVFGTLQPAEGHGDVILDGSGDAIVAARRGLEDVLDRLTVFAPGSGTGSPQPAFPAFFPRLRDARAARLRGELETAGRIVSDHLLSYPGASDALLESGRVRLVSGDHPGALDAAAKLEKLEDGKALGRLLRAEVHYAQGDVELGDAALNLACDAGLPDAFLMRALRRTPAGDPAEAMREDLRSAFEKAGDSALGDCARGLLLLSLGHAEAGEEMLTKALEKDDLLSLAYRYRAEARAALDRNPTEVARDCDAALELGVEGASVWFTRGLARLRGHYFTLAIRDFMRCIDAGVDPASATYNIACAHSLAGNAEEALDWLSRSLEAGFRDFQHARADPDLLLLRDDPRFEGILRSRRAE